MLIPIPILIELCPHLVASMTAVHENLSGGLQTLKYCFNVYFDNRPVYEASLLSLWKHTTVCKISLCISCWIKNSWVLSPEPIYFNILVTETSLHSRCSALPRFSFEKMQSIYTIFYKYNLLFNVEYHALLSIIGFFQIFQMISGLSAIRAVCYRQCHLVVTKQQEVTTPPSWLPCQNALQNDCLHDVRVASLFCELSQFC